MKDGHSRRINEGRLLPGERKVKRKEIEKRSEKGGSSVQSSNKADVGREIQKIRTCTEIPSRTDGNSSPTGVSTNPQPERYIRVRNESTERRPQRPKIKRI